MSKARTLANFISDNNEFADGTISVSEVSGAAPLASPSFTGATSIASGSLSVTGTTGIALGDATPATFGSGVPTVVFQGTAANGRGGAINFREYAASGDGAITSQIYSTDGADGYGFVLNAEQGSIKLNAGGLTATKLEVTTSGVVINETGADNDFRVESDNNSNMLLVDAGNDRVQVNSVNPQSTTLLSVRGNGNNIEWGHNNTTSGYYGVLGANNNNGNPFIAFSANANSGTSNTYDTDGFIGTILRGTTGGELSIEQTLLANADNQVSVQRLGIAATEIVVNEASTDTDFRVESDNMAAALFVEGSSGLVGIGNNSPVANGNQSTYGITIGNGDASGRVHINANGGGAMFSGTDTANSASAGFKIGHLNGTNRIEMEIGTTRIVDMFATGVTFNNGGVDQDFRVESDTNTHMLFVDAGANKVGIGTSTPGGELTVSGTSRFEKGGTGTALVATGNGSNMHLNTDGSAYFIFQNTAASDLYTVFKGSTYEAFRFGAGNATFNEEGRNYDFRVESDGNAHMFMIDAGMNKAAFGTSPQTALGGLLHTGSLSVGAANHIGYSVYSNHEGNIPSSTTVSVMDFEGPAYARYMKVTVSGYLCRKEVYFAGYQSWDNQTGAAVGDTTVGTQIFAHGSNAGAVTIYLEVLSTSGTSGNPKYRLKISTGGLSGQLYDTTSVVEFFNPPQYVTYQ